MTARAGSVAGTFIFPPAVSQLRNYFIGRVKKKKKTGVVIAGDLYAVLSCVHNSLSTVSSTRNSCLQYLKVKDVALEPGLPLWRKLCFAVGGMPYQMTSTVIGFFLNIFLLEVAEVRNGIERK